MKVFMATCTQPKILPWPDFPADGGNFPAANHQRPKDKVVFVMGPTGTGKSRLSVDLASRFQAEIINSDKIQVHRGLHIVTNKITEEEARGVPHHLLDVVPPSCDFTASDFRRRASSTVGSILSRGRLPIVVGGSNSFVEALADGREDATSTFGETHDCLFLCVHVSMPVLHDYVSERVDKMVECGMVEEVRGVFDPSDSNYTRGIKRAIGVPEFDWFFRLERFVGGRERERLLRQAIEEIKRNTSALAQRQMAKIERLRKVKRWKIRMIDATEAFLSRGGGAGADETWERLVAGPSADLVARFLLNATTSPQVLPRSSNRSRRPTVSARERMEHCLVA